ncbi:MAG: SMP-30/gluconolactonase/LRE family protein, partial [Candidatus Omnitrophica bacterium]|nr:SMP-30/gluconolactonase/LRE family protein [Candidatus Omnitrophota bacterium]
MRLFQKQSALSIIIVLLGFECAAPLFASESTVASEVEKIADGFLFTEGPVWHKDGYLLFSDIPAHKIVKWSAQRGVETYREESGDSNGLAFDHQGRLIACEHGGRRISRTETDGSITCIADQYKGKRFNSPNDCAVRSDGMIFFTDPDYGLGGQKSEIGFNGVYCVKSGQPPVLLAKDFNKPNGVALSPDEKILYVADTAESHLRAFDVQADGTLKNGRILTPVPNPDGMAVDVQGNLYVTASTGVEVFDSAGKRLTIIEAPEQPANCGFGGEENKTLFITARKGLYKVRTHNAGLS